MRLFVCWGLFRTPRPGHPCRNAWKALRAAGHDPEVIRARGWGLLPAWLNRTRGRREVRRLTGQDWVPVLAFEGEVVSGTEAIVAWAAAHPRRDGVMASRPPEGTGGRGVPRSST